MAIVLWPNWVYSIGPSSSSFKPLASYLNSASNKKFFLLLTHFWYIWPFLFPSPLCRYNRLALCNCLPLILLLVLFKQSTNQRPTTLYPTFWPGYDDANLPRRVMDGCIELQKNKEMFLANFSHWPTAVWLNLLSLMFHCFVYVIFESVQALGRSPLLFKVHLLC